jgi:glycosyltransferase involved in cell wall biosynthesis
VTSERPLLSVVMPVYNEEATISRIIERVLASNVASLELVVVDDASGDGTKDVLVREWSDEPRVRLHFHDVNRGKGAALRTGFRAARGQFVLVQDADLEYDPADYPQLLEPLTSGRADVVFGSRFSGGPHRVLYYWHMVGNRVLTTLSNMVTDLNLSDMEVCYKAFRREVLDYLDLREDRFGIEPELTAKLAQLSLRVYEVPVSYHGRTYEEGKKIGWKDGVAAIYCIFRYGVPARLNRRSRPAFEAAARDEASRDPHPHADPPSADRAPRG